MVNPLLVLFIMLALGITFILMHHVVSGWLDRSAPAFEVRLAERARTSDTLLATLPPSVFLKPVGDEAALALTWTAAMAALMQAATTLLFRGMQRVGEAWRAAPRAVLMAWGVLLGACWSWGTAALLVFMRFEPFADAVQHMLDFEGTDFDYWFSWFSALSVLWTLMAWTLMLIAALGIGIILCVAWLAAAGAGMPTLQAALFLRMSVEAIPTGSHRLVLVDVSTTGAAPGERPDVRTLNHSALYDSPGAIDAVLHALDGFETRRGRAPGPKGQNVGRPPLSGVH